MQFLTNLSNKIRNKITEHPHLEESILIAHDFGIHLVLEGRKEAAKGIEYVGVKIEELADKVDISPAQDAFVNNFHAKMEARKAVTQPISAK